jgi:uncharacterized protein (DUF488 family)
MRIYTIGFTKTSAESFFKRLSHSPVRRLIDVRLNNSSQLAGFAKRDDLEYFLWQICATDYEHRPELAPTEDMLKAYRKGAIDWPGYEQAFLDLMKERRVEETLTRSSLEDACLLCSEHVPGKCHRRLVAEYLAKHWGDVELVHL